MSDLVTRLHKALASRGEVAWAELLSESIAALGAAEARARVFEENQKYDAARAEKAGVLLTDLRPWTKHIPEELRARLLDFLDGKTQNPDSAQPEAK